MAAAAVAGGLGIFGLVLAATVLSVAFATRGAMASNRPIVEVLHFVGAKEAYIASQFQRHFLVLGLKGGIDRRARGDGVPGARRTARRQVRRHRGRSPGDRAVRHVLDRPLGYAMVAAEVLLIAVITAITSRRVVLHTLRTIY